ncbi:hypothetical protein CDAR_561641 [Caerostris darwini]|uniref:Uncharacterized protein n=1 Tax=Caerostris darwini TaxID=1538125 RepID=A0AAV4MIN8_9ARAC|nr:hypothetical protein CDAR_561641 [Caerostris darwini]
MKTTKRKDSQHARNTISVEQSIIHYYLVDKRMSLRPQPELPSSSDLHFRMNNVELRGAVAKNNLHQHNTEFGAGPLHTRQLSRVLNLTSPPNHPPSLPCSSSRLGDNYHKSRGGEGTANLKLSKSKFMELIIFLSMRRKPAITALFIFRVTSVKERKEKKKRVPKRENSSCVTFVKRLGVAERAFLPFLPRAIVPTVSLTGDKRRKLLGEQSAKESD